MNDLRFLAHSPQATHDQVGVSAAMVTSYWLNTFRKWGHHDPADGDLLALQSMINNGHRLVCALMCLPARTPMSTLHMSDVSGTQESPLSGDRVAGHTFYAL